MNRDRLLAALLIACGIAVLFGGVLAKLVHDWSADENYSHGFLMVPLAAYVVWRERGRLAAIPQRPSWLGLVVVAGSIAVLIAGKLGVELFLTRIALLGTLAGAVIFLFGWRHLRAVAFPFLLLFLAVPIPAIIFNQVAMPLQMVASRFGVAAISMCQIPVLREGNVIVLATTTLEVAEACSGIRSLVSLIALAVIWGYLAESPTWLRWLFAFAAAPIAIFANGIRVAGTGILSHYFGPAAAQGFFHTFSGWLVFIVAGVLLLAVHRFALWLVPSARPRQEAPPVLPPAPEKPVLVRAAAVAVMLLIGAAGLQALSHPEMAPTRAPLTSFPLRLGEWSGRNGQPFSDEVLAVLGVDEYITRDYRAEGQPGLGLYIGYYKSQRDGRTMHSPMNCMPGSGWEPVNKSRVWLDVPAAKGQPAQRVEVNRLIVQKGLDRLMVHYWYQGHGRVVASEYWGKIYTVLDAIRMNRSDGSMVRLIATVDARDPRGMENAVRASEEFARQLLQALPPYLPN
jgi:exosortase D (VPLPA-CTERM-specific)